MVSVLFVGSGDAFGSGGRFQTCILVEGAETKFLLDCGPSSLIAMRRMGVEANDIDVILLTHLHGDHFGGIPFFLLDAQSVRRRERALTIAGPPGSKQRLHQTMELLFPGITSIEWRFPLTYVELQPGLEQRVETLLVTPYLMDHKCGAPPTALRVTCEGKIVTYTGDTQWNANLAPAARDADLFIAETSSFDKPVPYHMSYKEWMAHMPELTPKRFVATHMGDSVLRRLDQLECEYAEDGKRFEL